MATPMPGKFISGDPLLRLAMALLFLVSATTKVTETAAIQAYMQGYGVPGFLIWPAAAFEYASGLSLILGYRPQGMAILLAGRCLLTALIFHRQFADLNQLMNFFKNLTIAGGIWAMARTDMRRTRADAALAAAYRGR